MVESIISLLVYAVVLAILGYLVVWVLGIVGVTVPPRIIQLFAVLVVLILILWFFQGSHVVLFPRSP